MKARSCISLLILLAKSQVGIPMPILDAHRTAPTQWVQVWGCVTYKLTLRRNGIHMPFLTAGMGMPALWTA